MPGPFRCKADFYEAWQKGLLGNKPRTWDSVEEAVASGSAGEVALRYRGTGGGGPLVTGLHTYDLKAAVERLGVNGGWREGDFNVSEVVNGVWSVINGEVTRNENGLTLRFSTVADLMRPSLAKGGHNVRGLIAKVVLETLLWPTDYDTIMDLIDEYPDHVVEFSGYDRCVGVIPGRRMIVWEVRQY